MVGWLVRARGKSFGRWRVRVGAGQADGVAWNKGIGENRGLAETGVNCLEPVPRNPLPLERFRLDGGLGASSRAGRLAWALGPLHLLGEG